MTEWPPIAGSVWLNDVLRVWDEWRGSLSEAAFTHPDGLRFVRALKALQPVTPPGGSPLAPERPAQETAFNRVRLRPGLDIDGPDANGVVGIHGDRCIHWLSREEAQMLAAELQQRFAPLPRSEPQPPASEEFKLQGPAGGAPKDAVEKSDESTGILRRLAQWIGSGQIRLFGRDANMDDCTWEPFTADERRRVARLLNELAQPAAGTGGVPPALDRALTLAAEATNGWACYAKREIEHREIARLHAEIERLRSGRGSGGE